MQGRPWAKDKHKLDRIIASLDHEVTEHELRMLYEVEPNITDVDRKVAR